MLLFDTSDGDKCVVKDIVKKRIVAIIPLGESSRWILDLMKSRDIISLDGKVYDEVNPFRKDD